MFRKIHSYAREIVFIFRDCVDWPSRGKLFTNTVLFHLGNWTKKTARREDIIFSANIRIGSDNSNRIELRRFAGDIFVLYEVLCDKCYYIPSSMLPPEKVRVVFDCGANIGITSLFLGRAISQCAHLQHLNQILVTLLCSNGMCVKSGEFYRFAAHS